MKERLLKFLNNEQISSARFAEIIGVQPSSVSHILSGRNNPGFDFIQKILRSYPSLNADWLILGKGNMLKNAGVQGSLFPGNREGDSYRTIPGTEKPETGAGENDPGDTAIPEEVTNVNKQVGDGDYISKLSERTNVNSGRIVEKIVVLYSDRSFSEYLPS